MLHPGLEPFESHYAATAWVTQNAPGANVCVIDRWTYGVLEYYPPTPARYAQPRWRMDEAANRTLTARFNGGN